jgi:hypothetical protein
LRCPHQRIFRIRPHLRLSGRDWVYAGPSPTRSAAPTCSSAQQVATVNGTRKSGGSSEQ